MSRFSELSTARLNAYSNCQPGIDSNDFSSQAINLSDTEEEYTSSHYVNSQVTSNPDLHTICTKSEIPGGIEQMGRNGINTPIGNVMIMIQTLTKTMQVKAIPDKTMKACRVVFQIIFPLPNHL